MQNNQIKNIDVVVVGSGVNALGVMRALGGEFNTLLVTRQDTIVNHTKYGERFYVASTTDQAIVEQLVELGRQLDKPCVLLLTEENTVSHVSEEREKLAEYFIVDFPVHQLIIDLQSKADFQQLAEACQAPIPKAVFWTKEQHGHGLETLSFPCVFKPLYQDASYSKCFKKAYKVASPDEVHSLYQKISPILPDMITQEWIEGEDSDIYFNIIYFDQKSEPITSFTGRKIRSWPRSIGGTASCVDAPEFDQQLTKYTTKFAKHVNYKGLMGMEYKFDIKRQAFYMIEPTVGRTDYQHEVAALSGNNILAAMCSYLLKQPDNNSQPSNKSKCTSNASTTMWFDEIADANAIAHGAPTFKDLQVKKFGAVHRWNDLGPYVYRLQHRIKMKFKGLL